MKQSYERQYYGRLQRNNWRPKKYLEMDSYFKSKNSIVWRSDRGTGDKVFQRTRPVQGFRSTVRNRWRQPKTSSKPINMPNVRILYRDSSVQDPIQHIRHQIAKMKTFNWARWQISYQISDCGPKMLGLIFDFLVIFWKASFFWIGYANATYND